MDLKNQSPGNGERKSLRSVKEDFIRYVKAVRTDRKRETAEDAPAPAAVMRPGQFFTRKRLLITVCVVFCLTAGALGILLASAPGAVSVQLSGVHIGYVEDEAALNVLLESVKKNISQEQGGIAVVLDEAALACAVPEKKNDGRLRYLTAAELEQALWDAELCQALAWGIVVDGRLVTATAKKKEAEQALDLIRSAYVENPDDMVETAFAETVEVQKQKVDFETVLSARDAAALLLEGVEAPQVYVVQSGDNTWSIARAHNIRESELIAANPGLIPEKLQIGQELNLNSVKPRVTLRTVEVTRDIEPVEYETVFENTGELLIGQSQVKSAGAQGAREVQRQIVRENGLVVESVEIGSLLLKEPQPEVTMQGTKQIPQAGVTTVGRENAGGSVGSAAGNWSGNGTGILKSPVDRIEISSAYGSRGGGRHKGVDLRNPKGTPIYAADDGVVTISRYQGSYGNLVIIDHGNGMETCYSHCDSLLVSAGETVGKGQQIATVGITGNATGYHLHFEVRLNGVHQNPMSYL